MIYKEIMRILLKNLSKLKEKQNGWEWALLSNVEWNLLDNNCKKWY